MFNKIALKLTDIMVSRKVIEKDDFDLYHYGLFIILTEVFLGLFSLCAGLIMKIPLHSLIFFFSFLLLHRYAGGFHADSELKCQIITLSGILISLVLIKALSYTGFWALIVIYLICFLMIILFSPSDTPEKTLTKAEKLKFKRICAIILVAFSAAIAASYFLSYSFIYIPLTVSALTETVSVLFGRLLNHRKANS